MTHKEGPVMTPEQKARVITELVQSRQAAAEMIEHHDREALRYRLQYKNLGDEITKHFRTPMFYQEVILTLKRSDVKIDKYGHVSMRAKKPLTKKK